MEILDYIFDMFGREKERTVPKNLKECLKCGEIEENLWRWASRIKLTGVILAAIIGAFGILAFFAQELPFWGLLVGTVVAVFTYLTYHTISLLICSLASIVQNTKISANVAMLKAAQEESTAKSCYQNPISHFSDNYSKSGSAQEAMHNKEQTGGTNVNLPKKQAISKWKCSFCGAINDSKYCEKCGADRDTSKTREEFLKKHE